MCAVKKSEIEPNLSGDDCQRIRLHLQSVLESRPFSHSARCQAFLSYIVEETLAGRSPQIKERNIGVDVFGKSQEFDPQEDSVVRVGAGDVRKRLRQAYQEDFKDGIRIELPIGSYCPRFTIEPAAVQLLPAEEPVAVPDRSFWSTPFSGEARRTFYTAGILLCMVVTLFFATRTMQMHESLDLLWAPFSGYKQPVLLGLPSPLVLEVRNPKLFSADASGQNIPINELNEREGYYTGTGAGWGAARFAEQLASRHQSFIIRFGKDVSFPDIAQSPAILLGGVSSQLGVQLTGNLRFRLFDNDLTSGIEDTFSRNQMWSVAKNKPTSEMREGYALITLLHHGDSGYPMMIVAGVGAFDTQAGAEFVTNREYFRSFANAAPRDWSKKNCQIVLHEPFYGTSPGKPDVVAWYVW